jgi:arylsulfatase A-like enzyme
MKVVFVLFDSLNRLAIGPYGGVVRTPNFDRFARKAVTFDSHYVGSLPCMPARRDLHTGRLNFMHRSWGPLEPFDNSMPEILKDDGIYTHLISDHLHYFEDGGATYHTRYRSFDFIRGQEYDPWKAMIEPPLDRFKEIYAKKHYDLDGASEPAQRSWARLQHAINREFMQNEADFPGPRCFAAAFEFLDRNRRADGWFLQIECFDPHEPFLAPERFKRQYETGYNGGVIDWPHYEKVAESQQEIAEIRANYAALVAMCDDYFGRLLDYFDEHDLWHDTALILTTDHGFLLSEHDWWGKNRMPYYEEISHIPLFIYHPGFTSEGGARRSMLTQTVDLMPTMLDLFGIAPPPEVRGHTLVPCLGGEPKLRDIAIFGMFGGPIGATDGRFAYYLFPENLLAPGLYEYTLMPTHLRTRFAPEELRTAALAEPFDFTKGAPVLRYDALPNAMRAPMHDFRGFGDIGTVLFDLVDDPRQERPQRDEEVEARLRAGIAAVLAAHDAPGELLARYGVASRPGAHPIKGG